MELSYIREHWINQMNVDHEHDHGCGGEHSHQHTHSHTHEHTHDGTTHSHEHQHGHVHSHEHPHEHELLHAHGEHHHHSHSPMEELVALMRYMTDHNAAHAKELIELAQQLDHAGRHDAYHEVMDAVADFEHGNARLSKVLASLDK